MTTSGSSKPISTTGGKPVGAVEGGSVRTGRRCPSRDRSVRRARQRNNSSEPETVASVPSDETRTSPAPSGTRPTSIPLVGSDTGPVPEPLVLV